MSSLVRITYLCLGFISPMVRSNLSKTDLGSELKKLMFSRMWGTDKKNEQLALRMYPEENDCFAEDLLQIRCTFLLACQYGVWLSFVFVTHILFFSTFLDKAKVSNCRVIVHCLAGISRSATIAIAYIMKTMGLSSDEAYR